MTKKSATRVVAFGLVAVFVIAGLGSLGSAGSVGIDDVEPITGTTTAFGGGSYVAFKLRDARFAVIYGTSGNPGYITIASETSRYLGMAEVRDQNGRQLRSGPISVRSVFANQLRFALEWRDANGNGIEDDGVPEGNQAAVEAVKGMSLYRAWEMVGLAEVDASEGRAWTFTLRAVNMSYERVWDSAGPRNGTATDGEVERMEFTFHVSLTERNVEGDMPTFNVTYDTSPGNGPQGRERITAVDRNGTYRYNGTALRCGIKYDHLIEGWDFAHNDSQLAIGTKGFLGVRVPSDAPEWMRERFREQVMNRYGMEGETNIPTGGQNMSVNGSWSGGPRLVTRDEISSDDNWQRVGRFAWESQLQVTNAGQMQNLSVRYQVHHASRVSIRGIEDAGDFEGFAYQGAFIYPKGEVIFHDPLMESEALFDLGPGLTGQSRFRWLVVAQVGVVATALVGVVAYRLLKKKGKGR
ncbi:MAG: hypothetical protein HZB92_06285 [Euryarchaeota archaeon]|nr:hypothetical protein [Euryarchaeota archaeon]